MSLYSVVKDSIYNAFKVEFQPSGETVTEQEDDTSNSESLENGEKKPRDPKRANVSGVITAVEACKNKLSGDMSILDFQVWKHDGESEKRIYDGRINDFLQYPSP